VFHRFLFIVIFINDVSSIQARELTQFCGSLTKVCSFIRRSASVILHFHLSLTFKVILPRYFQRRPPLPPIPSSSELVNLDFMANRVEVIASHRFSTLACIHLGAFSPLSMTVWVHARGDGAFVLVVDIIDGLELIYSYCIPSRKLFLSSLVSSFTSFCIRFIVPAP